jgi:GAF domain-containing protein
VKTSSLHRIRELLEVLERTKGDPGDLTAALQHIAQTAQTFFSADSCVIFAINPITNRYIESLAVAGNLLRGNDVPYKEPSVGGLAQQVLRRGVLVVEDLKVMPAYQSTVTRAENIRAFVALALYIKRHRHPLGVLYLNFRQPQQFDSNDRELFKLFADQASYILQETWLLQRYQEVARIGREINHELSSADNLFQKLQQYVGDILDTRYALLLALYQPQTSTLDLYLEEEGDFIFLENDPLEGACQFVIETLKPLFIQQVSKEAETLPYKRVQIKTEAGSKESLIFVPLVLRDVPLGVLSIQHPQPNAYNQEDLFILQLLANHIALALYNLRLYENLSRLNETGQLLTQQLDSEQLLQATAANIQTATKADVVVLYPYEPALQRFVLPPRIAGILLDSASLRSPFIRLDGIVYLALHHKEPIFAKESTISYYTLRGDPHIQQESFGQREKIRSTAIVPLQAGDELVGVLFVNFRQPQRFDATQKLFIEGLAHYAAIAIKNAQVFDTLIQRRMHELEILQNIDRELSRTLDLELLLNNILRLAQEQVPADESCILLYNSRLRALEIPAAIGSHAEARRKQIISLRETKGITRWVLEKKKPARVGNVHSDPQWCNLYIQGAADTISELDVPLLDGDEVLGVLNFESIKEGAFHQEDQDFLLTLAGQAVLAIKNSQAYEREKRLAEEGRVLNQISKQITSQLDLNHVFDLIIEKALELTRSTMGNLMLYDGDKHDLWMATERGVAHDKKNRRQSLDEGIVGYVARTKELLNVDLSQPPWRDVNLGFIPGTHSELAVPMLAGDELRGVLNVESTSPNNFNESDERLLQGLADLAVVALQNAEAFDREKRLVEEGQVLNEISRQITSQLDPIRVFDLILTKALELTNSTLGSLHLYDPDAKELLMVADQGVAEGKKDQHQKLGQGIVGYVAQYKQLQNIEEVNQHPWNDKYMEFFPGTHSELAVPMLAGDELRGVLNIESVIPNKFTEHDERLLQGLADLAVIALQNAQAYERERRLVEESQVLNEISKEITSQLDLNHVFDLILDKALELTHTKTGTLELYDPDHKDMWMVAERGVAKEHIGERLGQDLGIVGYVARTKQLLNVDLSKSPWNEIYVSFIPGTRSELAVPIMAGNDLHGVLNIESPVPNSFNDRDERVLKALADLAVIALQNAELYKKAEREAQRFELLYQAGQELSKIADLEQLDQTHKVVVQLAEQQSQSQAVIYRYDETNEELILKCAYPHRNAPLFERIKSNEGLNGQVAREQRTIVIHDANDLPPDVISIKKSDPRMYSFVVAPILFKDQYYGNLGLRHEDVGHFRGTDIHFFEGLAQQLASTIYRLETVQARQEFEQRALAVEEMSSIGQSAFELTHRLGNDLGLVELYINAIKSHLKKQEVISVFVSNKLDDILQAVQTVLSFSADLKQKLTKLGEAPGEPTVISPRALLEEAALVQTLPPNIQIDLEIAEDVTPVSVFSSLVADILRNLVANAIQAMPDGGKITLRAYNAGRSVALEVSDTGVGIPQQKLSNIFDLFFSTKGSFGFGLWSARRNALRNHGDLKVESRPGQGTTFRLLLPRTNGRTL